MNQSELRGTGALESAPQAQDRREPEQAWPPGSNKVYSPDTIPKLSLRFCAALDASGRLVPPPLLNAAVDALFACTSARVRVCHLSKRVNLYLREPSECRTLE